MSRNVRVSSTFDEEDFANNPATSASLQRQTSTITAALRPQGRGVLLQLNASGKPEIGDPSRTAPSAGRDRAGFTRIRNGWALGRWWDRMGRCRKYGDITVDGLEKELSDMITISGLIFALAFGAPSWTEGIRQKELEGAALCCNLAMEKAFEPISWGDLDWWIKSGFCVCSFGTLGLSGIALAMAASLYVYLGKFHPEPEVDDEWLPRLFFIRFQRAFAGLYYLLFIIVFITSPAACILLYMDKVPGQRFFYFGFACVFWAIALVVLTPVRYAFQVFKREVGAMDEDSEDEDVMMASHVPMSPDAAAGDRGPFGHAPRGTAHQLASLPGVMDATADVEYLDGRPSEPAPGAAGQPRAENKDVCPLPGTRSDSRQAVVEEIAQLVFTGAERKRLNEVLPKLAFAWHEADMYARNEALLGSALLAKLRTFVGSLFLWDALESLMADLQAQWAACLRSRDYNGSRRKMVKLTSTLRGFVAVKHPLREGTVAHEANSRVYTLKIPIYAHMGMKALETFPAARLPGSFGKRDRLLIRVPYAGPKSSWRTDRVRVFGLEKDNVVHGGGTLEGNGEGYPSDDVVPRRLMMQLLSDEIDPSFLSRAHRAQLIKLGLDEMGDKMEDPVRIGSSRGPFKNIIKGCIRREVKACNTACTAMLDEISAFWQKECVPYESILSYQ
eukprot:jgi/Mesvir1/17550/Mv08799-RA.1